MEFLSLAWFSALAAIIVINIVLAGDNALVIALAARSLPRQLRNRAIIWGTVGAIVVRSAMTIVVVWLLGDSRSAVGPWAACWCGSPTAS